MVHETFSRFVEGFPNNVRRRGRGDSARVGSLGERRTDVRLP